GYKVVARLNRAPKAGSPLIVIATALSVPSCSKPSRYGLVRAKHAARLVRRPILTASARIDLSDARVGMKKRTLRSNQETGPGKFLDKESPIQRGVAARSGRALRHQCEFGDQVGTALGREREHRAEATRRECLSVGSACEADIVPGRRTAGPDLDGDGGGAAQAADSNQQECAFAFFWPTRHHLQKKACRPKSDSEQTWLARADVGYESKACLIRPGCSSSTRP